MSYGAWGKFDPYFGDESLVKPKVDIRSRNDSVTLGLNKKLRDVQQEREGTIFEQVFIK